MENVRNILMIVLSVVLAIVNAAVSLLMVVLAVPGSGTIGPGFRTIAITFLAGNLASFAFAIFSGLRLGRKARLAGLLCQIATIPFCLGMALFIMWLFGINEL